MNVMMRLMTRGDAMPSAIARMQWCRSQGWDADMHVNKVGIDIARSEVIAKARESNADYLIMVDDDVVPTDRILRLPEHGVPVVSGCVPSWSFGKLFWCIFDLDEDGTYRSVTDFTEDHSLQQVYSVGGALLCIRRDVLEDTSQDPLFLFRRNSDGTVAHFGGEDCHFCQKVHRMGYPIYADPGMVGEHTPRIELVRTLVENADPNTDGGLITVARYDTRQYGCELPVSDSYRRMREQRRGDGGPPPEPAVQPPVSERAANVDGGSELRAASFGRRG
jgi:hypothetical protein